MIGENAPHRMGADGAHPRSSEGAECDSRGRLAVTTPGNDADHPAAPARPAARQEGGRPVDAPERALPDVMESYLREIGRTPLLGRDEEIALAQRAERGDRAAADALAQANLRLVVSVARRYASGALPLEDLIAEGNIGLLRAVQKYEWRRGYRFSTYAVWWIRQAITRAILNQGQTIRVPVHRSEALARRSKAIGLLSDALGREPTAAEIVAALGQDMSVDDSGLRALRAPYSLDRLLADDGSEQFGDILADTSAPTTEERAVGRVVASEVRRVLGAELSAREREVLRLRFGLDGAAPAHLDEIGRRLGITRERVRQIEAEALRKLRRPSILARLRAG